MTPKMTLLELTALKPREIAMLIQKSPNKWSCVPAAFATATGIDLQTILDTIGHDGSEIVCPEKPEPYCYRSFYTSELVIAMFRLDWLATEFDMRLFITEDEDGQCYIKEEDQETMQGIVNRSIGVICGVKHGSDIRHASAWDGDKCYDPNGFIYPIDHWIIEYFYKLTPFN